MWAEQAVFASADCQHRKGYQLIAQSDGIDSTMATVLCRWAPSHGALVDPQPAAWSLSYFPVDAKHVAIARTTHGGAEYSGRGGMEVVTTFLVLHVDALTCYGNDPLSLARTAMALGYLRLPNVHNEHRAPIRLPDESFPLPNLARHSESTSPTRLGTALDTLLQYRRVVVLGEANPLGAVQHLLDKLPMSKRLGVSFTTGLTWSMQREFQLQFLPSADPGLRQRLAAQDITCAAA